MEMQKRQGKSVKIFIRLINQIVDPYFLLQCCIFGFLGYALLGILDIALKKMPMFLYVSAVFGACLLVAVFRWDWPAIMKELSIDEEAVRRAVEAEVQYHSARLAERKENYNNAAELYEKVLVHDGSHMQARFNLARLYIVKLKDRDKARSHLQILVQTAPQGHPYRNYAVEQMANMSRERAS
jgi:tetratricopeptide (TPR) repeat protein